MARLPATGRTQLAWYSRRVRYSPAVLGLNYPWINNAGSETVNWLDAYDFAVTESDLALIASWGITKIRAWAQLESVMGWSDAYYYGWQGDYRANLDDFLTRCTSHGLQVILVVGDGKSSGGYASLDGKFRWTFVTGNSAPYLDALTTYVSWFRSHPCVLMWELQNEPYANLTWSPNAIASGATQAQTHSFLVSCYQTVKPLVGTVYTGFSDYEEEDQAQYQLFSSAANRAVLVDDCTDVYSMHVYRGDQSQVADFRTLTGKPKWCSEVGSYNYYDPTGSDHPVPAYNELDDDSPNGISGLSNPYSVRSISAKLINSGFGLIMPWAFSDNPGLVGHNPDGTYLPGSLVGWIQSQFASRTAASGRQRA